MSPFRFIAAQSPSSTDRTTAGAPFSRPRAPISFILAHGGPPEPDAERNVPDRLPGNDPSCAIAPAQTLRGAHQRGRRSLDFAACFGSLRRTSQSECELPHILWPSAALLLMKRSLPGPSMPGARIEFFRLSRGTVGGACGCCHYDVFRRPIGTGRPFDQSIANDDPSRETQGPSMAGPLDRTVSPAKWSLAHEALATKRARRRDPRSNWRRHMHGPIVAGAACLVARHDIRPLWPRELDEDKLVQST